MKKHFKTILQFFIESAVCLILVSIFFGFFLMFIGKQFPSGTVSFSLFGNSSLFSKNTAARQRDLKFLRNNKEVIFGLQGELAAILSRTNNSVKSKRAAAIAWRSATEGMSLYDHDAIQTYNRSSARIKFDPQSYIDMRENSLIIIKRLEKDFIDNERRSFVVVADGEFRGRFLSTEEDPVYIELETPHALARIKKSSNDPGEVDFKININPDKSSSFIVYEGKAQIEGPGGKVELVANQMTSVGVDGKPTKPEKLPDPIKLRFPEQNKSFVYRKLPPKITFAWKGLPKSVGYFFQLAQDPSFLDPVYEEITDKVSFEIGSLKNGIYYWRVASMAGKYADVFSHTRTVVVEQDLDPPRLTVNFPENIVRDDSVSIKGWSEPGSIVYIDNNPVSIDPKGNFVYDVKLIHGINVIIVEASDQAGNTSYRTKLVNRKS